MLRPALTIIVAAAFVLGGAGCSGDDAHDTGGDTDEAGLRGALARVAATDQTRVYAEYGDVELITKLADSGTRFRGLTGYGFSTIAPTSRIIADELGFDPAKMDGALAVGQPPDWAGVLWGDYDVDAVDRELADRDIPSEDSDGGTRWTSAGDREVDFDGPLTGIARTSEFNDIRTASGSFAYAPARSGVDWVTAPGDDTLADDPVMRRLSGCLGDVAAAILTEVEGDSTKYAVGVRVTDSGDATEVACLAPDRDAKGLRDRVERELGSGTAPSTRQPWDELLPDASVDLAELSSVVRIEARPGPDDPVGRVLQMLHSRDLTTLAGA